MQAVYSSVKLVSSRQLKFLFVVAFLVAIAFGSDKIEHPSGTEERQRFSDDDLISMQQKVQALWTQRATFEWTGGVVYTRWGRTVCNTGSDVVYDGVAGGSWYSDYGGGSNYLCLPKDPIWGVYDESLGKDSKLYGAEYEEPSSFGLENNNGQSLNQHDAPCVVCQSQTKTVVVMIPARNQCYNGWHAEYTGYLVSAKSSNNGRTEFICMDGSPESFPGGEGSQNGAGLWNAHVDCGSLPCPPYASNRELTCVVCTK